MQVISPTLEETTLLQQLQAGEQVGLPAFGLAEISR